jgi:hypothetical protein
MSLNEVVEDIVVTTLGWRWSKEHDELYEYIHKTFEEFLNDKESIYETLRSETKRPNV